MPILIWRTYGESTPSASSRRASAAVSFSQPQTRINNGYACNGWLIGQDPHTARHLTRQAPCVHPGIRPF